ncbi:hypothetical protein SUGI_0925330 [Cryptomeria japonica]|nr:hypothetical protein SUGI_0925330 [Cryptomeria japonica]
MQSLTNCAYTFLCFNAISQHSRTWKVGTLSYVIIMVGMQGSLIIGFLLVGIRLSVSVPMPMASESFGSSRKGKAFGSRNSSFKTWSAKVKLPAFSRIPFHKEKSIPKNRESS